MHSRYVNIKVATCERRRISAMLLEYIEHSDQTQLEVGGSGTTLEWL